MTDRSAHEARFLTEAGWGAARAEPLAGDASVRRYMRLHQPSGETAVLMDAPGADLNTPAFVALSRWLAERGFSPPEILARDMTHGFLLLEDLGDALFARLPEDETRLYSAAIDMLATLHRLGPPEGPPRQTAEALAALAAPVYGWYRPEDQTARETFEGLLTEALAPLAPTVLTLRDFHAENLIWLPDRTGVARVGLLDFQDAWIWHPAYDLISLVEDARRDVAPELRHAMIERYIRHSGQDPEAFHTALAATSLQRQLRIVAVFARLCLRGKPQYLDLIPRVWAHAQAALQSPSLAALRAHLGVTLPEPSPDHLSRLRTQCPTRPAL